MMHGIKYLACALVFVVVLAPPRRSAGSSSGRDYPVDDDPQVLEFPFYGQGEKANDIHIRWKQRVHVREARAYHPNDHPPGEGNQGNLTGRTWNVQPGANPREGNDTTEMTLKTGKEGPDLLAAGWLNLKIDPLDDKTKQGPSELVESFQWSLDGKLIGEEKRFSSTGGSGAAGTAKVATTGGLKVITFATNSGTIKVYLPDDMRAGDTISGTVTAEPKGQTPEERATNEAKLREHVVALKPIVDPKPLTPVHPTIIFDLSKSLAQPGGSTKVPETFAAPTKVNAGLFLMPNENSPAGPCRRSGSVVAINESCSPISQLVFDVPTGKIITADPKITPQTTMTVPTTSSGAVITPEPKITPTFIIPPLGQTGRPIEIFGPFDGNLSNTTLRYGPANKTVQDFEKNTENVSGGFGLLRPLAESPRKIVFAFPANVTGPMEIMVKERDTVATGTARNVGVNLSAPKTNLLKGEKTTLTVQVSGLEGIKEPMPLILECKGVITMEGGIYQPLIIQPSQVGADGRYTTTRGITGVQTGGWEATATVVTGRFNVWLQDDSDSNRLFHFNSFTGEYIFACGGGSCRSGGTGGTSSQPPTGSSEPTPPVTLTGTGKPAMKGCIITLSHNAPDRRVFARLDACTKTGDASVQTNSPKTDIKITDKNTADSTAPSTPPK